MYFKSATLEHWIVDMLIYEECRKLSIEIAGREKHSAINKVPFFMRGTKRRMIAVLSKLLPHAVAAYQCLDPLQVDWSHTEKSLNDAYLAGVEWRQPLPNFVSYLAIKQRQSATYGTEFLEIG